MRSWNFNVYGQGWRYHMSNINAAIRIAQLERFDAFKLKRQSYVCFMITFGIIIKMLKFIKEHDEITPIYML